MSDNEPQNGYRTADKRVLAAFVVRALLGLVIAVIGWLEGYPVLIAVGAVVALLSEVIRGYRWVRAEVSA